MSFTPDDPVEQPVPDPTHAGAAREGTLAPVQGEAAQIAPNIPTIVLTEVPSDPVWDGWDILRLIVLTIVALFAGVFAAIFFTRWLIYPHRSLGEIARVPLVVVAGQSVAYVLVLAYMYILVTRERGRRDFLARHSLELAFECCGVCARGFRVVDCAASTRALSADSERAADRYLFSHAGRGLGARHL